jgi:predicted aspartyl protease
MGSFFVACQVHNHVQERKTATVPKLLVDTGSEYTWIPQSVLMKIGVKPREKDVTLVMANGGTVTRNIGFAILRVGEHFTIDEVVFAQEGDLCLLGARTLEGMNLRVDSAGEETCGRRAGACGIRGSNKTGTGSEQADVYRAKPACCEVPVPVLFE